jgi:hypothetical protein
MLQVSGGGGVSSACRPDLCSTAHTQVCVFEGGDVPGADVCMGLVLTCMEYCLGPCRQESWPAKASRSTLVCVCCSVCLL